MARSRNLKPSFFTNDELAECSPLARLLFAGLWVLADKEGRLEDRPKRIKAEVLPYDDCDCNELAVELHGKKFIKRYEVAGARYIQIVNFKKHQNPHPKEQASVIPEMPENDLNPAEISHAVELHCKPCKGDDEPGLIPLPIPSESFLSKEVPPTPKGKKEPPRFAEFFSLFPAQRKGNRSGALRGYIQALNEGRATEEELIHGVTEYRTSDEVKRRFAKGAAAWLADDRWKVDYRKPERNNPQGPPKPYSHTILDAAERAERQLSDHPRREFSAEDQLARINAARDRAGGLLQIAGQSATDPTAPEKTGHAQAHG